MANYAPLLLLLVVLFWGIMCFLLTSFLRGVRVEKIKDVRPKPGSRKH